MLKSNPVKRIEGVVHHPCRKDNLCYLNLLKNCSFVFLQTKKLHSIACYRWRGSYVNGVITLKERNKCIKRIFKEMFSDSEKIA